MYYIYYTRCLLKDFPDSKKFKISGVTLNHYQKPLLLFMKHILCWSNYGDLIIDVTSGTWTLAVSFYFLFLLYFTYIKLSVYKSLTWIRETSCIILACVRLALLHYTGYFQGENLPIIWQNSQGWRNANIIQEEKVLTNRERCPSIPRTGKQNLRLGKGKSDQRI